MTDFAIPDNPAELLSEQAGHWQVHEEASTTPWSLEQHAQRIANDAVAALCDDGAFSVAFSAINNFASLDSEAQAATVTLVVGIPMREGARRAACDLSAGMVGTVLRACKHVVQIGAADEAVARCRAALKAAVYLLSWLVQVAEKAHAERPPARWPTQLARARNVRAKQKPRLLSTGRPTAKRQPCACRRSLT